jgi:hypothetical protein
MVKDADKMSKRISNGRETFTKTGFSMKSAEAIRTFTAL